MADAGKVTNDHSSWARHKAAPKRSPVTAPAVTIPIPALQKILRSNSGLAPKTPRTSISLRFCKTNMLNEPIKFMAAKMTMNMRKAKVHHFSEAKTLRSTDSCSKRSLTKTPYDGPAPSDRSIIFRRTSWGDAFFSQMISSEPALDSSKPIMDRMLSKSITTICRFTSGCKSKIPSTGSGLETNPCSGKRGFKAIP